jgi:hypothetical protein
VRHSTGVIFIERTSDSRILQKEYSPCSKVRDSVFNKDSVVISCIVLEKVSVHLANALAMFALSCRHRISSCAKRNQDQRWPPSLYKVWAIKANDNRVIVVHNKTIQLITMVTIV